MTRSEHCQHVWEVRHVAVKAFRFIVDGARSVRKSLPLSAIACGLVPVGNSVLKIQGIANPLAPPGLQGKAGQECELPVSSDACSGALCHHTLKRRHKNLNGTTRYEYKGTVLDGFSHSSPLAFRSTSYWAEETFNYSGVLISSHVEYHDQGINITFLGANGKRLPIENVVDVTTQRTGTGYTTAIYTYDNSLFVADTLSDGQITNLQLQSKQRRIFSFVHS